jgi:flagellar secretion chaperone FliS
MFRAAASYGRAGARYRNVDVTTKIEGASPHRLVGILFEELLTSIASTVAATRSRDLSRRGETQSRSLAILQALDSSLDFEKGGEIAKLLASVYGEVRRLLLEGVRENDASHTEEARKLIAEIASAWDAIG